MELIDKELNEELGLDDLDNVKAGIPFEAAINTSLDNQNLFRDKQIEDLKKQKEYLKNLKEKQSKSDENQIGTIRM